MIIIKLQGGLGNQMFQYAAAIPFIKTGRKVYLDCDFLETSTADTTNFTARIYELGIFNNIRALKAKPWHIKFFKSRSVFFKLLRYFLKSSVKYVKQQENEYVLLLNAVNVRYFYLDGYFQSENYFKNFRQDVLNHFQFPSLDPLNESIKKKIAAAANPVSIHVRRGDYIKPAVLDMHGVLPPDYYEKALNMLNEKCPSLTLFIFSDDVNWARQNLNLEKFDPNFIDNNGDKDGWKDMALMSFCKHHIIANSSFSWWGAWLSSNNGHVFAPQKWFNPLKVKFNIRDFIPDNWTIVSYD